jgi:multidrug efflux pump subunit AcrA (membrane-fusion protein)
MRSYRLSKIKTETNKLAKPLSANNISPSGRVFLVSFSASLETSNVTALEPRPSYKIARVQSAPVLKQTATIVPPVIQPVQNNEMGWRAMAIILLLAATATTGIYFGKQYLSTPLPPLSGAEQVASLGSTVFTGTIKPANEIKIAAVAPAIVQGILVKVGDEIKEGQELIKVDDREAKAALLQAEIEKKAADQQVAQINTNISLLNKQMLALRSQVTDASGKLSLAQRRAEEVPVRQRQDSPERAQAVYDQALSKFQRTEILHRQGLVSAQELDEIRSQLRIAEADLKAARAAETASKDLSRAQESQSKLQGELTKKEQQQQLTDLKNQLEQAQLRQQQAAQNVENASRRTSEATIKATHSGVIVEIPVKVGDQVIVGTTLAKLAQLDRLIVEIPVSARLVNSLHVDQTATIKLPTTSQPLKGKIITINPIPAANLNHTVEVEFENTTNSLLAGQSAEVKFAAK